MENTLTDPHGKPWRLEECFEVVDTENNKTQ